MTDLDLRLTAALAAYRQANATITSVSLALIGQRTLTAAPNATVLRLEWSDQGDYLTACDLPEVELDADTEDALDNDLCEYTYNLDGGSMSIWSEYGEWDGHPDRSRFVLDLACAATAADSNPVHAHLDAVAREAGYEVMDSNGVLGIIVNRESVPDAALLSIDAAGVNDLYDQYVGPAIDQMERALADEYASSPCTEECAEHQPDCDGFCDHGTDHTNGCETAPYIGL
jgi:hypothetical protein